MRIKSPSTQNSRCKNKETFQTAHPPPTKDRGVTSQATTTILIVKMRRKRVGPKREKKKAFWSKVKITKS